MMDEQNVNRDKGLFKYARRLDKYMAENPSFGSHITFGCQSLDDLLKGGLPFNGLTEIYGESGTGKSQIAMQLAVTAQLPKELGGTGKGVVYFVTGHEFPTSRLMGIVETFKKRFPAVRKNYMDYIFIQKHIEPEGLLLCAEHKLADFLKDHEIGLVIVDSMGIFRHEQKIVLRSQNMRRLAMQLKNLATVHNFAILCINEATSVPSLGMTDIIPSLGLSWSNLITKRIKLSRTCKITPQGSHQIRTMSVMHSPEFVSASAEFIITEEGICNP